MATIEQIRELFKEDPKRVYARAKVAFNTAVYSEAGKYFREIYTQCAVDKRKPSSFGIKDSLTSIYARSAECSFRIGNFSEAAREFGYAISALTKKTETLTGEEIATLSRLYANKSYCHFKSEEYGVAEETAVTAIERDQKNHFAHFVMGEARFKLEKYDAAMDSYKRASDLKPDFQYQVGIIHCYINLDERNEAIALANKAREGLSEDDPKYEIISELIIAANKQGYGVNASTPTKTHP